MVCAFLLCVDYDFGIIIRCEKIIIDGTIVLKVWNGSPAMSALFDIPNNRSTYLIYFVCVIVIATISFGNLAYLGLDAYDDRDHMQDTPAIIDNWMFMFSDQRLVEVRPPVDAMFVFGYLVWEDNPMGYHMMQVVLHCIAAILLLITCKVLGAQLETALFSSMLFLLNVVHFQAIHQITCITYTLSLIFSFLCIFSYAYVLQGKPKIWKVMSIFALVGALFSHPASVFIVLFCIYLTYKQDGFTWKSANAVVPLVVTAVIFGIAAFSLSLHGDQVRGVLNTPDFVQMVLQPFWYWGRLFASLHWISPALLLEKPEIWELVVGLLFVCGFVLLIYFRISPVNDWAVWIFLSVLPFVNYPNDMLGHGPSRHLYFASAGASVLFAWSILTLIKKWFKRYGRFVFIFVCGLIFVMSIDSLKRVEAHTYYRAGRGYIAEKNLQLGETQLSMAISIDSQLVPMDIFERLAVARFSLGIPIRQTVLDALKTYPQSDLLYMILGISYLQEPDATSPNAEQEYVDKAFDLTQNEQELRAFQVKFLQSLGTFFYATEQYEKAILTYEHVLEVDPKYVWGVANLGKLYQLIGQDDEALFLYNQLVTLDPVFAIPIVSLSAEVFYQDEKIEHAIQMYQQVIQLNPNDGDIYYQLGLALKAHQQYHDAKVAFSNAIRFHTIHDDAHRQLEQLLEPVKNN